MVSQIDPTVPVFGTPTTQSVRDNFLTAKNEISALQQETQNAPFLPISGGRMGGPMYLFNDPTDAMMPATKGYVDAGGGSGGGGIPEAPADDQYYGRFDGSWQPVLSMKGGTLIGKLILAGDATDSLGATTKEQLDAVAATVLADAPSDANTYGRHAAAWTQVLPIAGGQITGSLGIGLAVPTSTAPKYPCAIVVGSVTSEADFDLNAYQSVAASGWTYVQNGFATRIVMDVNGVLNINLAPSGNAGAAITWRNPFAIDQRGCVILPGAQGIPSDSADSIISASRYVTPTASTYGFNAYNGGGTMKTIQAGYAGWTTIDPTGVWGLTLFPSSAAGGALTTSTSSMSLDQSGTLSVSGLVRSRNGRIQSQNSNNNPSVTVWDIGQNTASGFWLGASNCLYIGSSDGGGNPGAAWMSLSAAGGIGMGLPVYISQPLSVQLDATDVLMVSTMTGNSPARTRYNINGVRVWTCGVVPSGYFAIADETGAYVALNIPFGGGTITCNSQGGFKYPNSAYGDPNNAFAFGWQTVAASLATVSVQNGGAAYALANASDARMKFDIAPSSYDCLATISRLTLRQFRWQSIADPWKLKEAETRADAPLKRVGLIAQEVKDAFPEGVFEGDEFDDHLGRVWGLDANIMFALLVGATQQLTARLEALEART